MKIVHQPFPKSQYFHQVFPKRQIVLHHTVSPSTSIEGDVAWWAQNVQRVATAFIVRADGTIFQLFDPKYWAHHLAVNSSANKIDRRLKTSSINAMLNQSSIGIEIDSAGGLRQNDRTKKWYSSFGTTIATQDVVRYTKPYRGFNGFERYTDAQIEAVRDLLLMLTDRYKIPTTYRESMWNVDLSAIRGTPGIWTHTSYRTDKSDCHPQPELIQMLTELQRR